MNDEADESWCVTQCKQVLDYLSEEGFQSPSIGDWPAWHITPIISVWAIESVNTPGSVGWWVVSGDCPTDYTTCSGERHPRQALRDFGRRWREAAANWANGQPSDGVTLGDGMREAELADALATRAQLLLDFANDDGNWLEK